jgi:hypothetical protein
MSLESLESDLRALLEAIDLELESKGYHAGAKKLVQRYNAFFSANIDEKEMEGLSPVDEPSRNKTTRERALGEVRLNISTILGRLSPGSSYYEV